MISKSRVFLVSMILLFIANASVCALTQPSQLLNNAINRQGLAETNFVYTHDGEIIFSSDHRNERKERTSKSSD